jgi:RNA polymerase sigma-70 factor (ECF subfamily)
MSPPPHDLPREHGEGLDDVSLMARCGKGDHDAFAVLVERHQVAVVGTVAKMMGSPSDAEDLAQQVFLRVWKSAPRYRPKAKFTTWLFTITRNLVFNETRRRYRKTEIGMDSTDAATQLATVASPGPAPDSGTLDAELRSAIDAAIADLPENGRLAVILRRYEDMPYEEIAKVLDTTVPAVKSLLFRSRAQLKRSLKHYLD